MMFKSGTTVPLLVGECLRNEHQPEPPALLILTAAKSTRIGVLGVEGLQIRYPLLLTSNQFNGPLFFPASAISRTLKNSFWSASQIHIFFALLTQGGNRNVPER